MNRALAFFQKRIPYLPELKPICGNSITATILMQQLEYWFGSHESGFFKFISPCEHPSYKPGDSWTEELGFSKDEFRLAFSKIGVRYGSKKQFQAQQKNGNDPFQGKLYLSYQDRIRGTTIYRRNTALVDRLIIDVINPPKCSNTTQSVVQPIDLNRGRETQSPEVGKADLRKSGNPMSGRRESRSPYKEHKTTTETTTKTTAAIHPDVGSTPTFAAAVKKQNKNVEPVIHAQLTPEQQHAVEAAATDLAQRLPDKDTQQLAAEIVFVLLDPQCFTQSGRDFHKKLNTIKKVIRSGQWRSPAGLVIERESAQVQQQALQHQRLSELTSECEHWQWMVDTAKASGKMECLEHLETELKKAQAALKAQVLLLEQDAAGSQGGTSC